MKPKYVYYVSTFSLLERSGKGMKDVDISYTCKIYSYISDFVWKIIYHLPVTYSHF